VVTAAEVWAALAEIPDPEIPVISLVDLGVIKDVAVEDGHVQIDFTPTFMGCPALETMQREMHAKVQELGASAEVRVVLDDSWSTDKITPAGRLHAILEPPAGTAATFWNSLPPLLTMEKLLFRMLLVGFVLLTLTVGSGVFFSEALFGKPLTIDHKTLFAFASWGIFATLLIGRHAWGWRGKRALRLTLVGFALLVLAYVGSRFVAEVILGRI